MGPSLPLQCPVRASDGWSQVNSPQILTHIVPVTPSLPHDVITDPSDSKNTDPDMALGRQQSNFELTSEEINLVVFHKQPPFTGVVSGLQEVSWKPWQSIHASYEPVPWLGTPRPAVLGLYSKACWGPCCVRVSPHNVMFYREDCHLCLPPTCFLVSPDLW